MDDSNRKNIKQRRAHVEDCLCEIFNICMENKKSTTLDKLKLESFRDLYDIESFYNHLIESHEEYNFADACMLRSALQFLLEDFKDFPADSFLEQVDLNEFDERFRGDGFDSYYYIYKPTPHFLRLQKAVPKTHWWWHV